MRKTLTPIAMLALLSAGPAFAGWEEGVAAFKSRDYQTAYQQFQEYVGQNPTAYQGHLMLGQVATQLGRNDEALNHLRKAYDLNPNELSIKLGLGRAYATAGRYADVAGLFKNVDGSSLPAAQQTFFYQVRATARAKTNDEAGALADFAQLSKLKPSDAKVQFSYGTMALAAGRDDQGLASLKKAIELDGQNEDYRQTYVKSLVRKARTSRDKATKERFYKDAASQAKSLVALNGSYDNLMLQVSAELGARLYDQAITTGKAALAKKSSDWKAHYYLGQAYAAAAKYSEAEAPLIQARTLASGADAKTVWKQIGFIYQKQKKYDQAFEAYEKAGDSSAAAKVREQQETDKFNQNVEEENARIREMEAEAAALEAELEALEGGGGR